MSDHQCEGMACSCPLNGNHSHPAHVDAVTAAWDEAHR